MIVDLLVLLFSNEIMLCCNRWPPKFVQVDFEAYVLLRFALVSLRHNRRNW
jgi:hypothetical protein